MQTPPNELKRLIVPRWRSPQKTPLAELQNHRPQSPVNPLVVTELEECIADWSSQKSAEAATELLWASSVFGVTEASSRSLGEISSANDLTEEIRSEADDLFRSGPASQSQMSLHFDEATAILRERLKHLKRASSLYSKDPIVYVELARIYSRLGQTDQARQALRTALSLAPTSRYVLRAATRFFVHVHDLQSAIEALELGSTDDPWIQASKISVCDLGNLKIEGIKKIRPLLQADIEPRSLSELAGSLATLEFGHGNVSRAKKLFRIGAQDPNDNVVAQLHWASRNKIVEFSEDLLNRSLTFEARASFELKNKNWQAALGHAEDWLVDEPFSVRPAWEGSYLAVTLLGDAQKSIEFCSAGLTANPDDFCLLNNMAFSHAMAGDIEQATQFALKAEGRIGDVDEKITLKATRGAIHFRNGNTDAGTNSYLEAIELAIKERRRELAQQASVHYFTECARVGNFLSISEANQIRALMEDKRISENVRDIYNAVLKPILPNEIHFTGTNVAISPMFHQLIETD